MKKFSNTQLMVLAIVLVITSFFLFRLLLSGKASTYTTEMAAAFLGTLLTIIITATMLNKQSEVDMRKDRNAKRLEAKWEVYKDLTNTLQTLLCTGDITRDSVVAMQILNQRIAYIGGKDVVEAFRNLVNAFALAAQDGKLTDTEMDELLRGAGALSVKIRLDLASGEEREALKLEERELYDLVAQNVQSLRREKTTGDKFSAQCDSGDQQYYDEVLSYLSGRDIEPEWGTVGFSIKRTVQCYPTKSGKASSIDIVKEKLGGQDQLGKVTSFLAERGIASGRAGTSRISVKTAELSAADLCALLSLIFEKPEE